MKADLADNLVALINASVELANCIQEDIKLQGYVSDETVLALNKYRTKHDELNDVLDIANGLN